MKLNLLLMMALLTIRVDASAAAGLSDGTWETISDVGAFGLIGVAVATPVVMRDWKGLAQASLSIGLAEGVSALGKAVIHEKRPDKSDNKSFPSGHSAGVFSSATTLYRRYGWKAGIPAYAVATLTASARVAARKHFVWDVAAGALIGIGSGWLFTDALNDKVQWVPWADTKGGGFMVSMTW